MKKLMVLGASPLNKDSLLEIAKREDVVLIVLDGNQNSIGKKIANKFYCVNIKDLRSVLNIAKKNTVDGIFSLNDHGIRTAAWVADQLSLQGMSLATANAVVDKGTMREVWRYAGIPQPQYRIILHKDEVEEFAKIFGYPVVIKPVDCGGGGRGVSLIHSKQNIEAAFLNAKQFAQHNNRLIIEQFIEGTQTAVEVVRFANKTHVVSHSELIMVPAPSRVGAEISYPGNFSPKIIKLINEVSDKIMRAMGLKEGIGHIEYIISGEDIFVIEMGSRPGGGHIFHPIASHVSGMNYPQWVADFHLGTAKEPIIQDTYQGACYLFLYSTKKGRLAGIDGVDQALDSPKVHSIDLWKTKGDILQSPKNGMDRYGSIVALADTQDEAIDAARKARDTLSIFIEDI